MQHVCTFLVPCVQVEADKARRADRLERDPEHDEAQGVARDWVSSERLRPHAHALLVGPTCGAADARAPPPFSRSCPPVRTGRAIGYGCMAACNAHTRPLQASPAAPPWPENRAASLSTLKSLRRARYFPSA